MNVPNKLEASLFKLVLYNTSLLGPFASFKENEMP